ncbi:AbrB/MazE/SpoVT family DNA-binding domain-containing protein [Microvirga sp. 0TCS3.31]
MQVAKWGNSLAVRLPAAVVEALELKEGDDIAITVAGSRTFEVSKKPEMAEVLARLGKYRSRLPEGFKFDGLEANERQTIPRYPCHSLPAVRRHEQCEPG